LDEAEEDLVSMIPRSHNIGKRPGDPPADEADRFIRCPACDGWIDCRDLGQVFEHEGPLPHPAQDQPQ
jgi:CRISPR/Cas system type I-B associated protein Csh2 (Cas7 group RAMP superfamily)